MPHADFTPEGPQPMEGIAVSSRVKKVDSFFFFARVSAFVLLII